MSSKRCGQRERESSGRFFHKRRVGAFAFALIAAVAAGAGFYGAAGAQAEEAPTAKIGYLTYTLDTASKTASVKSCDISKDSGFPADGKVAIPSSITYENAAYSVTSLGRNVFGGDENHANTAVKSVDIPNSVTSLGDFCFCSCTSLAGIDIPNSVTELGEGCFSFCKSLTSVNIPGSVTSVGEGCFTHCSALTSATIQDGVTSLGDFCFWTCPSLANVTIPGSVTSLGGGCFSSCRSLANVTIQDGVPSLSTTCFASCISLTSIAIPDSVTSLGEGCFSDASLTSITVPASVTSLGEKSLYCSTLAEIVFEGDAITDCDGDAFNYEYKGSPRLENKKYIFEKTIPDAVASAYGVTDENCYYRVKFVDETGATVQQNDVMKKKCPYTGVAAPALSGHPVTGAAFKGWDSESYKNVTNSGMTITGQFGAATAVPVSDNRVGVNVAAQTYTGAQTKPALNLTFRKDSSSKEIALVEGVHYNVVGLGENIKVGKGTVKIEGAGNFCGQRTLSFDIVSAPASGDGSWKRLAGGTAIGTMKAIVNEGWSQSDWAIVATTKGYYDALSASGLAGLLDCPILMTAPDKLSDATSKLITSKKVKHVIVVGGTSAVSANTFNQIKKLSGVADVERVAGGTAIGTANAIYERGKTAGSGWGADAIVATAGGFQDALSIAPYAYAKAAPIFLAGGKPGTLSAKTLSKVKGGGFSRTIIVGGEAAVAKSVEAKVPGAKRLGGGTAYGTSNKIATFCQQNGMTSRHMGVATGRSYYDALAGAALCGKKNSIIILADDRNSDNVDKVVEPSWYFAKSSYIFGGTAAVSQAVETKIKAASY